ncbi:MAG: PEP-CTERM sorting domain-containing protein [Kiritimatiellales bacterium]
MKKILYCILIGTICLPLILSAGVIVEENFDGYGGGITSLNGQNGGNNWNSAWSTSTSSNNYGPAKLTYSLTGYVNNGGTGSTDGSASATANTDNKFSRSYASSDQSDIWFSCLMFASSMNSINDRVGIQFGNSYYLGIKSGVFGIYSASWGTAADTVADPVGQAEAVLVIGHYYALGNGKISMEAWLNPTDVSSVAALGTGANYVANSSFSASAISSTVTGYLREDNGNRMSLDALRITYGFTDDDEGLTAVVVPEPVTIGMFGLGALAVLIMRRQF